MGTETPSLLGMDGSVRSKGSRAGTVARTEAQACAGKGRQEVSPLGLLGVVWAPAQWLYLLPASPIPAPLLDPTS